MTSTSSPAPHSTRALQRSAPRRSGRLRWPDAFTLLAVGLVVLLVSLPRLREFALRENQGDASSLVVQLGNLLGSSVQAAELGSVRELVQQDVSFAARLGDSEFLAEGRLLRRHGYLFEIVPAELEGPGSGQAWRVRAWPWEHGRSGLASFIWLPDRGLAQHANADGRWSGPEQPPAPRFKGQTSPDAPEWRLVKD